MQARIMNKTDSKENWENNNPILLKGEMTIVDGKRIKVGNGIAQYSNLPFLFESQLMFVTGMIMLWSGSINNIPEGWMLCDGNNGTPNLTDRFVLGAGAQYQVGDTGGEAMHTLTIDEIPSHNHENQYPAVPPSSGGGAEGYGWYTDSYDWGTQKDQLTGGGQPHNNMPPYYALCYIMKT